MVQTAHDTTRPLDRPATEYPTCATIPSPLHQVSYSYHDPHHFTPCRTCHLRPATCATIPSPNETKIKSKTNETISDSHLNLAKSMTYHNQTKELTIWFLTNHP
jgi:hypothetical protein